MPQTGLNRGHGQRKQNFLQSQIEQDNDEDRKSSATNSLIGLFYTLLDYNSVLKKIRTKLFIKIILNKSNKDPLLHLEFKKMSLYTE